MWNGKMWGRHEGTPEQQNIDIDHAWPPPDGTRSFPAEFTFNPLDDAEQLHGEIPRLALHGQIQKPRLLNHILRLGFVHRRPRTDPHPVVVQRFDRPLKVLLTSPNIGA